MLSDRCLSVCLSCHVCNLAVLWPNGWPDQDETWHGGRSRSRPHCARWGLSSPPPKRGHSPSQFSAHVCCAQTAGWIKMSLGTKVGLGPGRIVLHGDPAPPPKRDTAPIFGPCLLWPNGRPSRLLLNTCINMTPAQKILCLDEMLLRCHYMCPHIPHISDRTTSESRR